METIMLTIGSVLCPVDFSEQSRHALLWASAITPLMRSIGDEAVVARSIGSDDAAYCRLTNEAK
jgi:hypothetical protein